MVPHPQEGGILANHRGWRPMGPICSVFPTFGPICGTFLGTKHIAHTFAACMGLHTPRDLGPVWCVGAHTIANSEQCAPGCPLCALCAMSGAH